MPDHLGCVVHLLDIKIAALNHTENGSGLVVDQNASRLFNTFCFAVLGEITTIFGNTVHCTVYFLINRGIDSVTAGH
ncbi:hypothetical protein D3C71_1108990 [compost metagenome]